MSLTCYTKNIIYTCRLKIIFTIIMFTMNFKVNEVLSPSALKDNF